jgi:predicted DNA-binding protein with PD1-like motif
MQTTEGQLGRIFVIRLEDGDLIPTCIERFAEEKHVKHGFVLLIGGIGGGQVVVGPRYSGQMPPDPMLLPLDGSHEVAGVGILAPGEDGKPGLHIHAALGRAGKTTTGCLRPGVNTWLMAEAVLYEITDIDAKRIFDKKSGFNLLQVSEKKKGSK